MFSVHDIHNTPSILIVHTQTLNSVLKRDLMKEDGVAGVGGRFCQSDGHVRGRGVTNLSSRKLTQPKKQVKLQGSLIARYNTYVFYHI